MQYLLLVLSLLLTGCQLVEEPAPKHVAYVAPAKLMAPYTVHDYVSTLSIQLSNITGMRKNNARIAVTSFFDTQALDSGLAVQQGVGLSQQIQESLLTQFTQLGYHTVEHRLNEHITVSNHAESILSRDVNTLRLRQNIDFIVTGTLTQQQHAYIVNARLINMQDGRIVSAATTEIPINAMWTDEKVQQRNGLIYRTEY
jgi:TolB-like protein